MYFNLLCMYFPLVLILYFCLVLCNWYRRWKYVVLLIKKYAYHSFIVWRFPVLFFGLCWNVMRNHRWANFWFVVG